MAANQTNKSNKKVIIGVIALIAVIAALAAVYFGFRAKPVEGAKAITIEVIDNEQVSTVYEVHTDAEFLHGAMDDAEGLTYTGYDSSYGFTVDSVNGVAADFNTGGAYWSFYVNGEYCMYGVDQQPVVDGDAFLIQYEVYVTE